MSNLPVPAPAQVQPGNFITASLWNANTYNGLTYLLNPPIFYGVQATSQNILNTTNVAITLDTGVIDTYNGHSNTTNNSRYTAQVAGYYSICGAVGYQANGTGVRSAKIYYNGAIIQGSAVEDVASSANAITIATPVVFKYLNVNDYVELWTWQNSGVASPGLGTTAYADQACSMSVMWIHA